VTSSINTSIFHLCVDELARTVSHSGKSTNEILNALAASHPEITYDEEDWNEINQEIKDQIVLRVKRTLSSID
jgi:hypothetical protein